MRGQTLDSTVQSLLYPNSKDYVWNILYRIFYRPYLILFQDFDTNELEGIVGLISYSLYKQRFSCRPT